MIALVQIVLSEAVLVLVFVIVVVALGRIASSGAPALGHPARHRRRFRYPISIANTEKCPTRRHKAAKITEKKRIHLEFLLLDYLLLIS
jgi:hypothetical protein